MKRALLAAGLAFGLVVHARAHDVSTTPITWNREISRIFSIAASRVIVLRGRRSH